MMSFIHELFTDETGATMTDYAVLLALVSVACMAAIQAMSEQIVAVVNSTTSTLAITE